MSVSLCMQAFQEMGKREKTFQNFCTKIIYTFCSQRKGKMDERIATFCGMEQEVLSIGEQEKLFWILALH